MGFLNYVRVWKDVFEPRLDEKAAPSLGGVHLGKEETIYTDPVEFFRRTFITSSMARILDEVANALLGRGGNKVTMLLSLFGGGKTHTLLTIYHAFRNPGALLQAKTESKEVRKILEKLVEELSKVASNVRVVVLDGFFTELTPNPINPLSVPGSYKVQTIWGSLAHQLGRFGEVRGNDEKLLAPSADVLLKVLGDEPVLILMDELADYVIRLRSSVDPNLQRYAEQILAFIEHLAKAVELSKHSVLVISLPVEERGAELVVEERYKPQFDVITSLHRSLSRVSAGRIIPVSPSDIPSVLKVRIFEYIGSEAAKAVSSTLTKIYDVEENREFFGKDAAKTAYKVEETYPFHPSYIDTLIHIVDRHPSLEKTRDAIRITRKVIRKLAEASSQAELVMPFHIDVEDREIRGILLSHEFYRGYETVVEEDIVERCRKYEKPELVKAIAKTVFVKTFVLADATRYRQICPDKHDVIISSFEPSMTRMLNLQPKDYLDALEWASKNLVFLMSEGGRYWFTQIASPIRMVEVEAKRVEDSEAMKKVEEYARKLLVSPYEEVLRKRGLEKRVVGIPFRVDLSRVLTEPKPVDHDTRNYILVAILKPVREDEIERIIYETPEGRQRRYTNTVYLIYPRDYSHVLQMLGFAKQLIACEKVQQELDLVYKDEEVRDVMKKKLEKYCRGIEGVEGLLLKNILTGLNVVAYPQHKEYRNTYEIVNVPGEAGSIIIERAVRALKNARPQKFYDEELDFDHLDLLLSRIGISLSEGDSSKYVSEVIDYFYSNPKLPMVKEQTIKDALLQGIKQLRIGVKKQGKVFFKKIYECRSAQECTPPTVREAEPPPTLDDSDLILPWRIALQEQLDGLKEVKEEKVSGGIRRIWYAFYIDGKLIPVAKAVNEFAPDILRDHSLVKVTEFLEEGVDIKLDRYEVEVMPGEEATITVFVERLGEFKGTVMLEVTDGKLSFYTLSIGAEQPTAKLEWRIKAPQEPGTYNYELRALDTEKKVLRSTSITVIVKPVGIEVSKGVPPKGTKLSMIEIEVQSSDFKPLRIIDTKLGSVCGVESAELELKAKLADMEPRITLKLDNVTLDDVKTIFSSIAQRYGIALQQIRYKIVLKPRSREYIEAPEFTENEKKVIENCMRYYEFRGS